MDSAGLAQRQGVLPSQAIEGAIRQGMISGDGGADIPEKSVQPASLDLRLGPVAYRLRCSFLPDTKPVSQKLKLFQMGKVDLGGDGGILERNRPYLVPLMEHLDLPAGLRGKANPKSSTGRLDIFTRVITDNSYMFDEIPAGYSGRLYLEVVPRTFTIRVREGLALNQLRLMCGRADLSDADIVELHGRVPLLFRSGQALRPDEIAVSNGLFLGLNLGRPGKRDKVGFMGKENSQLIDLSKVDHYNPEDFWELVKSEPSRIVLQPEKFYLLLSRDHVVIPPDYAAEMTAFDPTSGELRTHYAGFFDPGFGCGPNGMTGSRAALEVRAHDVPFAVEHGQNICKLSFERMSEAPAKLYGQGLGSSYQDQVEALGKHFNRKTESADFSGMSGIFETA